jgi:glycosyltransferase involved in cell wall biosynthesis
MHILILGNDPKSLVNFRGPLVEAMLAAGHRVSAAGAGRDAKADAWFQARGVHYHDVPMERAGLNPLSDWRTLTRLTRLMRKVAPDLLFAYTIKPVVYGLIAAKLAGVKRRTAMISGLGYAFTDNPGESFGARAKRSAVHAAARAAYGLALRCADTVIFQNPDDRDVFARMGLTRPGQKVGLVNGSGVDLDHYRPASMPDGPITFLMIARLLRDKGVYEYVEAARIVKREHPAARFWLLGPFDPNPAAVKPAEVDAWVREGVIDYRGAVDDVRPHIAACHVFVLPSYREGMPRTVQEAMAMGRPVITTDVPGCRETVERERNGYLVSPGEPHELVRCCNRFLADAESLHAYGNSSQEFARVKFDARGTSGATLSLLALVPSPDCSTAERQFAAAE